MFERKKYKQFAKQQLKNRWTVPVLMTIVSSLILVLFNIPGMIKTLQSGYLEALNSDYTFEELLLAYNEYSSQATSTLTIIIRTLVESILSVAGISVYLKMSRSPEKVFFKNFIEGFNNWYRAVLAGLWQYLWVFIWTFLFIIPGIIKAIAYSQTFYIITEFENISITKAMRISILITKGHKADLFVTYLSFLGWLLISVLTFGIALFWVEPYIEMTFVNVYHALLKEAIETGKIKPEDLAE